MIIMTAAKTVRPAAALLGWLVGVLMGLTLPVGARTWARFPSTIAEGATARLTQTG